MSIILLIYNISPEVTRIVLYSTLFIFFFLESNFFGFSYKIGYEPIFRTRIKLPFGPKSSYTYRPVTGDTSGPGFGGVIL